MPQHAGAPALPQSDQVTNRQLLDIAALADAVGRQRAANVLFRFTGVKDGRRALYGLGRREADAFIFLLRTLADTRSRHAHPTQVKIASLHT